jgi:hypothetical protein
MTSSYKAKMFFSTWSVTNSITDRNCSGISFVIQCWRKMYCIPRILCYCSTVFQMLNVWRTAWLLYVTLVTCHQSIKFTYSCNLSSLDISKFNKMYANCNNCGMITCLNYLQNHNRNRKQRIVHKMFFNFLYGFYSKHYFPVNTWCLYCWDTSNPQWNLLTNFSGMPITNFTKIHSTVLLLLHSDRQICWN